MTPHRTDTRSPYDPNPDRRDESRHSDAIKGLWFRRLKPSEVLATIVLVGLLLGAAGWRYNSVSSLETRVGRMEAVQQRMLDVLCIDHADARACKEKEP